MILKSCEKCDFVTTQSHILGNHKKTVHDGIGFSCDKCNFMAKTSGNKNI